MSFDEDVGFWLVFFDGADSSIGFDDEGAMNGAWPWLAGSIHALVPPSASRRCWIVIPRRRNVSPMVSAGVSLDLWMETLV